MKKKILILIVELLIVTGLTFLAVPLFGIKTLWLRLLLINLINLATGASGYIAAKLSGIKVDWEWKNRKQYLLGIGLCLILSLIVAWIPALLGFSLVGSHTDFVGWQFAYYLFNYIVIIGPIEEMVFRVYIQKTLIELFRGKRWAGVLVASALFGLWHIINGTPIKVLFCFGFGCAFGFAKEYLKDMHYPGIALCHGLYDFLNYIVRLTIA